MPEETAENTKNNPHGNEPETVTVGVEKPSKKRKALKIVGYAILTVVLSLLMLNTFLTLFKPHYYPTFGNYRLFAIVSDSMEPEIKTGDMIVVRVPKSQEEIGVGTVITFEIKDGNTTRIVTHRVTKIAYNQETGEWAFKTRGDNAAGEDGGYRNYSDVVGIYTGQHCGVFGYIFGFLQSTNGAIALIVIMLILVLWIIVSNYVSFISIWRKLTEKVLVKSRQVLAEDAEKSEVVSDVIDIIVTEPKNKKDAKVKEEQLLYFLQYGMLSPLPYDEWFNEEDIAYIQQADEQFAADNAEGEQQDVAAVIADAVAGADSEETAGESAATVVEEPAEEVEIEYLDSAVEDESAAVTNTVAYEDDDGLNEIIGAEDDEPEDDDIDEVDVVDESGVHRRTYYNRSFQAKLIQLSDEAKEWYSTINNELLSYKRMRNIIGWQRETFILGRKTVAKFMIRGKTLCLLLDIDAQKYVGTKYTVEDVSEVASYASTPCLYRIKSERRVKYAIQLIEEMMTAADTQKNPKFKPFTYTLPYDSIERLVERGLAISVSSAGVNPRWVKKPEDNAEVSAESNREVAATDGSGSDS